MKCESCKAPAFGVYSLKEKGMREYTLFLCGRCSADAIVDGKLPALGISGAGCSTVAVIPEMYEKMRNEAIASGLIPGS